MKMIQIKGFALWAMSALAFTALADTSPEIKNVKAKQRYPWNGKVDITYEVVGDLLASMPEWYMPTFTLSASNRVDGTECAADSSALSGDIDAAEGLHHVVWDLNAQGVTIKSDDVVFAVSYVVRPRPYCVIDLSAGPNATSYPVSYLSDVPSGGFNADEYKTTKLVLKRIESGSFNMGGTTLTTLSDPFFCAIFEVTQKQYSLVMGSNPSCFSGDKLPVENVSYDLIRGAYYGANWPSSNTVDDNSFMGKLRARTGLDFDLPTDAQWEYACRAGATTTYSYGDTANGTYMWYRDNSSLETHEVGTKSPNHWGLYDMHGNVWEWCLDWYASRISGGMDPKGSSSGTQRVFRGGSYDNSAPRCASSNREDAYPSYESKLFGFRPVRTILENNGECNSEAAVCKICGMESVPVFIDSRVGVRESTGDEAITYSSLWNGGDGATVTIAQDGIVLAENLKGEGNFAWRAKYDGTFTFTHTTFVNGEVVGEPLSATFIVDKVNLAPPIIEPSGAEFENTYQEVSIGCDTDGATIYYTTDGSDPRANGREYKHPFTIYNTCTVRAIAAKDDWKDSTEVTVTFTRTESLSAAANLYGYKMESSESAWTVDGEVSHDGVSSIKSNGDGSYVQTSVRGAGTLSFWWRAMCEEPEDGEYYDYGVFKVGSAEAAYIAGNDTGWVFYSTNIATTGKHTLRWEYRKDDEGTFAPDCVWLDQVQWIPADGSGTTLTSPEPVPYSWLSQYGLGVASGDFEAAANAASGKTQGGAATSVWEEFVAGTDPTNVTSRFVAKIEMCNGEPIVTWEPDLNTNGIQRIYKVYGKENLTDATWAYPTNSLHRFFKVTVEMP
jgi:formylglycine-generating enzyme required for sulfatase activity